MHNVTASNYYKYCNYAEIKYYTMYLYRKTVENHFKNLNTLKERYCEEGPIKCIFSRNVYAVFHYECEKESLIGLFKLTD